MDFANLVKTMLEHDASDLYLTVGVPPMYRIEGVTQPIGQNKLMPKDTEMLARSIMNDHQWQEFEEKKESNLALSFSKLTRVRINVFRQRNSVGIVARKINVEIASLDDLRLPPSLKDIIMKKRGLLLIVGATGSGKSTTLAAMIDHRNSTTPGHILTIEDPVEFIHSHKKSIVNQREVGFDTLSFQEALKSALRQAPDVILIGEIRDRETMEAAITFADTGHLCLATLHSTNANQTFERIINFFPDSQHQQILLQLSLNLNAIISQRLVKSVDGSRMAALEILMDTARIKELIKNNEIDSIKDAMIQAAQEGCQTFDMALFDLYTAGKIDIDQALMNADSVNNLRLKIKVSDMDMKEGEEKKDEKLAFKIKGEGQMQHHLNR